jgi:predicted lipid-binding transport protein (Tim44 family)
MAAIGMGGKKNITMPTPSQSMTGPWSSSSATGPASASPVYDGAAQKMSGGIIGTVAAGLVSAAVLI